MSKALLFYGISEFTNEERFCKKRGLKPYETEIKILDDEPLEWIVRYVKDGFIYDVMECDQCYSGFMITLVRLPHLSFEELLSTALITKNFDERAGAIGMILKKYPSEFEKYLVSIKERINSDLPNKKRIIRIIKLINNFIVENTSYVWHLERILDLCKKLAYNF